MRAHKVLLSVAAAGAMIVGAATPAAAGENARARTTDANPGGEAYWIANGDTLKVCDIQHDGWGAYAEARHFIDRRTGLFELTWEDDGGDAGCDTEKFPQKEGNDVDIRVCLERPSKGQTFRFCSPWRDAEA
jgi:hypothetical protein